MSSANIGPFKYIGAVYFPDPDEPPPDDGSQPGSEASIGVTIYFGRYAPDVDGWFQVFADTFDGAGPGESNVVAAVDFPMSPENIPVPPELVENQEYNDLGDLISDEVTVITGLVPHAPDGGSAYVYYSEPSPRFTTSGSTAYVRKWQIKYKRYYNFLGVHHHELISLEELGTESFSCSGVVWHSDAYYHGSHFSVSKRIIGYRQT